MTKLRWIPLVAVVACSGTEEGPSSTTPLVDRIAEAYGDCTGTIDRQRDDQPDGSATQTYNADGDIVELVWNGGLSTEVTNTWEYGSAHEMSRLTVLFEDASTSDYEWTYDWLDGHPVEHRYDRDIDGQVDWIERREYDERGLLVVNEWDYDGDEEFDDSISFSWESDGEGWYGIGEGTDPYGQYTAEYWADAEAVVYKYTYVDDRGLSGDWEQQGRNELGLWARLENRESQDGAYGWEELEDLSFDTLGRAKELLRTTEYLEEGGEPILETTLSNYTYNCP